MKKAAIALAGTALILAGCEGGSSPVGAGAGNSESNATSTSESVDREKALKQARERETTQEVQLAALIVGAVQEFRPRWNGKTYDSLDQMSCGLGLDLNRRGEALEALRRDLNVSAVALGKELSVIAHGTQAENNAACVAWYWQDAVSSKNGWPRPNAPWHTQAGQDELAKWGAFQLGAARATSISVAQVAQGLAKMPGATLEQLSEKARQLLLKNASDYRQTLEKMTAEQMAAGGVVLDLTGNGPAPIHFTQGELDYQRGPAGALVSRGGAPLFGGGYLEGIRYTVEAVVSDQNMKGPEPFSLREAERVAIPVSLSVRM